MLVWRLCREPFADLTGEGSRRYGGRWNSSGRAMVYAASSAALAVLEVRVHLDLPPELLPPDYVLVAIELGGAAIEACTDIPSAPHTFGDGWLRERRTPVLQVPSSIVPECANFLINPAHPAADQIKIAHSRRFAFDRRLWL